ncbi:hypothetical protein FQN57_004839 [Myotisia sp. PD_48]|nr:hypothetical protein FQN57_004839 [Myotisia sp. PD_48]
MGEATGGPSAQPAATLRNREHCYFLYSIMTLRWQPIRLRLDSFIQKLTFRRRTLWGTIAEPASGIRRRFNEAQKISSNLLEEIFGILVAIWLSGVPTIDRVGLWILPTHWA